MAGQGECQSSSHHGNHELMPFGINSSRTGTSAFSRERGNEPVLKWILLSFGNKRYEPAEKPLNLDLISADRRSATPELCSPSRPSGPPPLRTGELPHSCRGGKKRFPWMLPGARRNAVVWRAEPPPLTPFFPAQKRAGSSLGTSALGMEGSNSAWGGAESAPVGAWWPLGFRLGARISLGEGSRPQRDCRGGGMLLVTAELCPHPAVPLVKFRGKIKALGSRTVQMYRYCGVNAPLLPHRRKDFCVRAQSPS